MKIAGFHSGHECSYCIVEDGIPILHAELERYIRLKEPFGDGFDLLIKDYPEYEDIKYFTHTLCTWNGGILRRHHDSYNKMYSIITKNDGDFIAPGHHEAHAAAAFYMSNLEDSLIVTIDGGGREYFRTDIETATMTFWLGKMNEMLPLSMVLDRFFNIGAFWSTMTKEVFGLSAGYPKGHQAGTIMAMSAFGDATKYYSKFDEGKFRSFDFNYKFFIDEVANSKNQEQTKFDIAAALQLYTENFVIDLIKDTKKSVGHLSKNLCLSGGVALNSVMVGRILKELDFENVYVDPVPYDGGLAIGSALYVYYSVLKNKRILMLDNYSPYLGKAYGPDYISKALEQNKDKIQWQEVQDEDVVSLLEKQNIVSVFGGGSESGRRALGNRSILADPRNKDMKERVNQKVKHRQWFRPFAPSILREKVTDWFERDVDSPYMSFVLKFKPEVVDKVPAVVHKDGSARLQTVTERDNYWYYNFIKLWESRTGVPILLNTSFNDQEPIVETPIDAINCYLKTDIDYLYFFDMGILVGRKKDA